MTGTYQSRISLAFITGRFPPMDTTGTLRVKSLRQHLSEYGIEPTFLTIPPYWMRQQNPRPMVNELQQTNGDVIQPMSRSDHLMRALTGIPVLRRLQRWLFVPDILVLWARSVARGMADVLAGVDAVYATGPPYSAYTAGRLLAQRLGVPLVLELRDPPLLDRRAATRGPLYMKRLRAFERRNIQTADMVVTLTPGVKAHLLTSYPMLPAERIVVVPNGSGPMPNSHGADHSDTSRARFSIVYAGSLRKQDDVKLLQLIARCLGKLPDRGVLVMVGNFPKAIRQALSRAASEDTVSWVGRVAHGEALSALRTSDVSLVLVGESEKWWIGRKVIESLEHAPQILAVAPPGDVADLLGRSSKSIVIPRSQAPDRLEEAIWTLRDRSRGRAVLVGPEPAVPTEQQVAERVAQAIRCVVSGASCQDWDWTAVN